jgi:hypothetical protein
LRRSRLRQNAPSKEGALLQIIFRKNTMNGKTLIEFFDAVEQCDTLRQLKRCGQRWSGIANDSTAAWTFFWKHWSNILNS